VAFAFTRKNNCCVWRRLLVIKGLSKVLSGRNGAEEVFQNSLFQHFSEGFQPSATFNQAL
jgi:hypothetical protein